MRKRTHRVKILVLAAVLALLLSACAGTAGAPAANEAQATATVAATTAAATSEPTPEPTEEPVKRDPAVVTIYTTNDLHGVLTPSPDDGVLGLPLVAGIAASTENSVLVDAGDATQGAAKSLKMDCRLVVRKSTVATAPEDWILAEW